ncbi:thioredoxin-like protein [Sordaria brevicollis]|uniref:Glutathione peroxidase n=1 Tax=Sordaria brevicollis TaxID=83679 RepID=A0AAE0UGW1_SORBR|nr:thioredoxin-like protein [Sordaria brevicollis]
MIPRRCHHRSAVALTRLVKPSQLLPSHQPPLRLSVAYKPAIHLQPVTPRHFTTTTPNKMSSATTFYDFKPLDKKGAELPLSTYQNKVVLIVNVASKCGFTPQYAGLEKVYKEIKEKYPDSFEILGFPCNQFGGQEPGTEEEISSFCQLNYGVSFPIMKKVEVNGDNATPLYEWMKNEKPGLMGLKRIKWNFEKFLIGKDGKVKGRWASTTKPESLKEAILKELGE